MTMNALATALSDLWSTVTLQSKKPAEPEPHYRQPRPMTGLFAGLTPEQRARAVDYGGPDTLGDFK